MARTYDWVFPLPRTHTGMLQGNGVLGAMIWGGDSTLCITLNRADFWDHRGGLPWKPSMNFRDIRAALEANDAAGLQKLFEMPPQNAGEPERPTVLPLGRIELSFDPGHELRRGTIDLETGRVSVFVAGRDGHEHEVTIDMAMRSPVLAVRYPRELGAPQAKAVTSWQYVGEYLKTIGFLAPGAFEETTFTLDELEGASEPMLYTDVALSGWVQPRPTESPICVGYRLGAEEFWVAVDYAPTPQAAQKCVAQWIEKSRARGLAKLREETQAWWGEFWDTAPRLCLPNPKLQFLYDYGMYKFAGLTAPGGVAATLQGPWCEEYQMPPWSSDYHFNINVQMCYSPAYRGNRLAHLKPLFDMVWSWRDTLRHNAKLFVGIDDGFVLPHAVDDRCTCMGAFWTGTIDHACTGWVGKMMFDYYLYSGDQAFLKDVAYPFMYGAMRVYEEMLEKRPDGSYALPVSVSPEYHGAAMNAWGRNASFQLACIHWLCESLPRAAGVLKESPRPIWAQISQRLPKVCTVGAEGQGQIALWEGTPLEESHRHHSHMAAIAPFDVIDPVSPEWRPLVERTLTQWIAKGMGMWSGWCVSWASQIHTRMGNADMAEMLTEIWGRVFTNEGHGTLHDCQFPGFTLMGAGATCSGPKRGEIMQMDAGMGTVSAIMDMLLHTRRGVNYLFAGAPAGWAEVAFSGLLTEGAFLVSARRERGVVQHLQVRSQVGGEFVLANPWAGPVTVLRSNGRREHVEGTVLRVTTRAGESLEIMGA